MIEDTPKTNTQTEFPPEVAAAVEACREKKAEELILIDLRGISTFTDYFIIMHGNSSKQNEAIYENVASKLKTMDQRALSVEGRSHAEWILMDYGNFILHIFSKESRDYYALEKLWADGQKTEF